MKTNCRIRKMILLATVIMVCVFCTNIHAVADVASDATTENTNATTTETTETVTSTETTETTETTESTEKEIKNGWSKNKTYYYVDDKAVTGIQKISGKLYLFRENGKLYKKKGLNKISGQYYYFNKDYSLKTGVVKVNKKSYYFQKKTGARYEKTGIKKVDGKYYYFTSDHYLKSGWARNSEKVKYYFDKETFAAKTGWNYVGKYKFYFNKKGQLVQDVRKKLTKKQKQSYQIKVNRTACCVTVYAKDGKKGYTIPVVSFICSTGGATPVGDFKTKDKLRWHELMGPCWGQWCAHITSSILFHSVPYNSPYNNRSLDVKGYNKLGTMASHGCIRLTAGDAKWIYDNCSVGTKVTIYNNDKDPGPFDKPKAQKLKSGHTWDPTDPTI